ncbi:DUF294 nucleotidyltransferase-like domain-containing protein [Sungkyunkwania multivorans]|uniref:DUF294 nucleotidyltransferase-like domain-containing protein n=1 Tax=Sungkyunkwania multivorans TaxID=1173618 RepID=A0ABW3CWQ9_9FLAO
MKNTIAERIYDFLKDFPPFSLLATEKLLEIAKNVVVIHLVKDEYIFRQGENIHDCFYVVQEGALGIFSEENGILIDECDEGDIFGLRALIRKDNYILSAKAIEESILYSISSDLLESVIHSNTAANKFLISSFVTNSRNPYSKNDDSPLFMHSQVPNRFEHHFTGVRSAEYSKDPVTCNLSAKISEAAKVMANKKVGSIVITKNKLPFGIITDKDFRTKIATGKFGIDDSVKKIMSSPVITYKEDISIAEAQIGMLKNGITHLCITKDGTPNSELVGILSEHDIVVAQGNNPSVLIKEVKRATTADNLRFIREKAQQLLKGYLEQQVPIQFVTNVISSINDAITKRVIEISLAEMDARPPVKFGWMALGSQGRGEQLLLTDQDNALVFDDVAEAQYEKTKRYFLDLSEAVTTKLNTVGFEYCPALMMASNPEWCLSVSQWKAQFDNWITKPDEDKIMLCTIFFDYNLVYGDSTLVEEISESIYESIERYEIFMNFLGRNALKNPPPLSFFRQFLVESSGEHKDQFDIKARAIMPLVDAARLLSLFNRFKNNNGTISRFEKLIQVEPQNSDLYLSCIDAFEALLRFRTIQGLKNKDSGRFVDLKLLSKADRLELRSCFKPIKDVQELISVRFQLSQIL